MNKLNKNTIYLLLVASLLSTSTFAQLICEIGEEKKFYSVLPAEPFSGIAYHPDKKIFLIPGDGPLRITLPDFVYFKAYNPNSGLDFNVPFSNSEFFGGADINNELDFEGITHLKDDYFALLEENKNKIYFLKYIVNPPQFEILSVHETLIPQTVNPNQNNDDEDGLEGISYDPHNNRLYVVREFGDKRLFSFPIKLPDTKTSPDSTGEIDVSKIRSASLANIVGESYSDDASGLFHLAQVYPANHPLAKNILVTSKFSDKLWEISLAVDEENNLLSVEEKKEMEIGRSNISLKHGGVVVVDNTIYVATENLSHIYEYSIKSENDSCEDMPEHRYNIDCECVACPSELWVNTNAYTDDIPLPDLYESSKSIETVVTNSSEVDVIINENETVDLKSDHITLNAGFKVESGGCLNAEIEPCE